ncbi:hypothetical protein JHK85_042951 [Glycine max]|nr:hypothetical protein JHK85_042951 [Glycine max]
MHEYISTYAKKPSLKAVLHPLTLLNRAYKKIRTAKIAALSGSTTLSTCKNLHRKHILSSDTLTNANFSSSNDILWCTEELNELRKVQFSRAEDHGDYGGIDPLYSNFGFFPDDPSTNHQKYHQQLQPSYHDYGKFDDNLQFDMVSPPLQFDA